MSILKIARMGHPVLRTPARPLDSSEIQSASIQKLIDDLFETMKEHQGIGLAAPQVHEGLRVFVAGVDDRGDPMPRIALINPEVTPLGRTIEEDWEGCLSIPDIRGRVPRAQEIRVVAVDRDGKSVSMTATGWPARVIQHETDHLNGILFLDRMKSLDSLTFFDEYRRYWAEDEN